MMAHWANPLAASRLWKGTYLKGQQRTAGCCHKTEAEQDTRLSKPSHNADHPFTVPNGIRTGPFCARECQRCSLL